MKKVFVCCLLILSLCSVSYAACSHAGGHSGGRGCSHSHHGHNHSHHGSSSSSQPVYLVKQDYSKTEQKFSNCDKHYMTVETVTYHYSDGTKKVQTNCTIFNADGSVIESDCSGVKHIIYNNNHYFIVRKGGCYLIDGSGNKLTKRNYSKMEEFKPNRLIVKYNKKYGIIDLEEKPVVPIKYQKFITEGNGIFITKLNGYWGIIDSENNVLVKNECEKIKPLSETILLKRYGKYGLCDLDGKMLFDIQYDKIKTKGEYIIVKNGKKYFVLNSDGERINDFSYKKIKLERNTLYGLTDDKEWIAL